MTMHAVTCRLTA